MLVSHFYFLNKHKNIKMIIKKHVIAGFNRGAPTYAEAAHLQARVAERLAEKLLGISAETILEIGCGTGLLTEHLLKLFPRSDFLLTDISSSMLELLNKSFFSPLSSGLSAFVGKDPHIHPTISAIKSGRAHGSIPTKVDKARGDRNIKLLCIDGEQLESLPNFDLITSSMTLHWFKDFVLSLSNIQKKLTQRGRLVFAMLGSNSLREWQEMCEFFQYPIATPHFPSLESLCEQFPEFNFQVEMMPETYPNVYTFLTTLKSLGAIATRADYTPLSPEKMRRLIRHFNTPMTVTYEVIYGEYQAL